MITEFFIDMFIGLLNIISWGDPITELPYGIDSFLGGAIGMFRTIGTFFPPFNTLLIAFTIYIGYKITIRLIALIPVVRNSVSHINTNNI